MPTLYTIGHSNHSISKLIELLHQHRIDLVADVRRYPTSRHNPQFNRPILAQGLEENGINYQFMGDRLGGKDDLDKVKARPEFAQGVEELKTLAGQGKQVAILCAEEDPHYCHRHWLLEPELEGKGVKIVHIRGAGQVDKDKQLKLF